MTGRLLRTRVLRPAAWLAVVVAAGLLLAGAGPAAAQTGGWVIERFDARIEVGADGQLAVTERIAVDFGSQDRHGIYRDIPVRYEVPADPWYDLPAGTDREALLRAIDVHDVRVSSPTAPAGVELDRPGPLGGSWLRIRIGDPDETISGRHEYTIRYAVDGAMDAPGGRPELFWDVTGTGWEAPIRRATATLAGPAQVTDSRCFAGAERSTSVCGTSDGRFVTEGLDPGEGMTVGAVFATGSVSVPEPTLVEEWSPRRALLGSPLAVPLTLVTALLALGGVGALAYRQGRDRVTAGDTTVDGRAGAVPPSERRRGLLEPRTVAVRYRPPEDLRPAQLGLLVDESVDPVDVSATVVDLAVRGYLTIEEVEDEFLWFSRTDWRLNRTDPSERDDVPAGPPGDGEAPSGDGRPAPPEREGLMHYEEMLLDGLFEDGDTVMLSDLKGDFAETYGKVQRSVYDNSRKRRWFGSRPDKARSRWMGIGTAALFGSLGLLVAAVIFTQIALAAVPLVIGAAALTVAHRWMPHRTPKGSRLLDEALGFREFIVTAEAERMDFAERERLFVSYLPYAVVFGATEHWAQVFSELGVDLGTASGFWVGAHGFHAAHFSSAMSDFSGTVGTALSTTPSSGGAGSGGFSGGSVGGGMGGGGGGAW